MALNTIEGCSQHFEEVVIPQLETEFGNVEHTQERNSAHVIFEGTRRYKGLRKYNKIFVWMNPSLQGAAQLDVIPKARFSGSLMYRDSRGEEFRMDDFRCELRCGPKCCEFRCGEFQWDDLNVMIDKIRELEGNERCNVCVLM